MGRREPRMSGLVIVLTLPVNEEEGHLSYGVAPRRAGLTVREQQAARTAGLLTERTRQRLWRARYGRTRHVDAKEPGELVCLDTFYIGRLKGVGKVWQITACDAASSYGLAGPLPAHDAAAGAPFLRAVLFPQHTPPRGPTA